MAKTRFAFNVVSRGSWLGAGLSIRGALFMASVMLGVICGIFGTERVAHADSRTDFLISRLKADDFRVRTSAALQLGATNDDGAVAPLCSTLADSNDVVRQAAAAALLRLAKPAGAGCVKDRLAVETSDSVKNQLNKTLAGLASAGGGGNGGSDGPPTNNPDAKFYVAISPITNNSGRSQGDVDRIVKGAIRAQLDQLGAFQQAPAGEASDAAKAEIAKRHLKGYFLSVAVDKFDYSNGNLRVKVRIAVSSYPGKALAGEVPVGLTEGGVSPGSTSSEDELMQMAAQQATQLFAKSFH